MAAVAVSSKSKLHKISLLQGRDASSKRVKTTNDEKKAVVVEDEPEQHKKTELFVEFCQCKTPVLGHGYWSCDARECPYCPFGDQVYVCQYSTFREDGQHCTECRRLVHESQFGTVTTAKNARYLAYLPAIDLTNTKRFTVTRRSFDSSNRPLVHSPVAPHVFDINLAPRTQRRPDRPYTCVVRGLYPYDVVATFDLPTHKDEDGLYTVSVRECLKALSYFLHSTACPLPTAQARVTADVRAFQAASDRVPRELASCKSKERAKALTNELATCKKDAEVAESKCRIDPVTEKVVATIMTLFEGLFSYSQSCYVRAIDYAANTSSVVIGLDSCCMNSLLVAKTQ